MGIVFRQSIKTTLVTFTGAGLGAFTTFVYTFVLTKTQLGFHSVLISAGVLLQVFVMLGMGSVLAVYIQKYPVGDERRKTLLYLSGMATLIATVAFTIIYILFREQIVNLYGQDRALVDKYYLYVPVIVLVLALMSLLDLYLLSQVKVAISAFVREIVVRIGNLLLVALLYFKILDFHTFVISSVLLYIIPLIILYLVSAKTPGFGFSKNLNVFSKTEYKGIVSFAWYHFLWGISLNLFGYLDILMLGILDKNGLESVAPYKIALLIITVMLIPYKAMTTAAYAFFNEAYINNDQPKLKDLFKRSAINILIVGVGMFSIVYCNLDNAVRILPGNYGIIKPIIIILMIGKLIDTATGMNNELISVSQYYKFNFRTSALLIVLIMLFNFFLIPEYGVYGAAWSMTIAFSIYNVLKFIFIWRKMGLVPFTAGSLQVVLAGAVTGVVGYMLPYMHYPIADGIVRTAIMLIIYGALLLWLKPSKDITQYLQTVKANKRLF